MSRISLVLVLILVLVLLIAPSTLGFVAPSRRKTSLFLRATAGGDMEDFEKARQIFESMIRPRIQLQSEYYTPPPMTNHRRRRRLVEMELLETLKDSDEAIDELMSLWMLERDADSAQRLQQMEQICSPGLKQEEAALRSMIADYGIDWPEPASRLAALLYFKGDSQGSMTWADRVLQVKPWHFEAIHLQRLNCLKLKSELLWRYARNALPPLNIDTNNAARQRWVENALKEAQKSFNEAEEQLHRPLGTPLVEEQENMWQ